MELNEVKKPDDDVNENIVDIELLKKAAKEVEDFISRNEIKK